MARGLARKVRLDGFRKGKVPLAVVRKQFARQVDQEIVERLARRHVGRLLKEGAVEPVAPPVIEKFEHQPDGSLHLVAWFEVDPPFDLAPYSGLEASRPDTRVTEADVDATLENLRQDMARLRTVEQRGARKGDDVLMTLSGRHLEGPESGKHFKQEGFAFVVGTDELHPDLSAALEGSSPGEEREVTIRYPDDYRTQGLAGRTILYRMRVASVRERQVPDLDDDLARDVGEFKDLAVLRRKIREDLERQKRSQADDTVHQALIRQLLARNPFQVPAVLVEGEMRHRLERMAAELASRGIDPGHAGIDWKKEAERQARRAADDLRLARILDAIAEQESIEAEEAEIDRIVREEAARSGRKVAMVRAAWEKGGQITSLCHHLRHARVLDFLASLGHIHNKEEQP